MWSEPGVRVAGKLAKCAPRLQRFAFYPDDGSRGGHPLTSVTYNEAVAKLSEEFDEHFNTHNICDISVTGGTYGV